MRVVRDRKSRFRIGSAAAAVVSARFLFGGCENSGEREAAAAVIVRDDGVKLETTVGSTRNSKAAMNRIKKRFHVGDDDDDVAFIFPGW